MFLVRHYLSEDERDPFQEWLKKLRDPIAKMQVVKRVNRIEGGNFGDHKFCRDGVWELRIDQGAGYRVYYAMSGTVVVTKVPKTLTLSAPLGIGKTGNGGLTNERSKP